MSITRSRNPESLNKPQRPGVPVTWNNGPHIGDYALPVGKTRVVAHWPDGTATIEYLTVEERAIQDNGSLGGWRSAGFTSKVLTIVSKVRGATVYLNPEDHTFELLDE